MNQKGFVNIILILVIVAIIGAVGYFAFLREAETPSQSNNSATPPITTPATQTPPAHETSQLSAFSIIVPNGGETFAIDSEVSVKFFMSDDLMAKISNSDVVQLYLVSDSGAIVGGILGTYVKDPEATFNLLSSKNFPTYYRDVYKKLERGANNYTWVPKETFVNAGLESRAFTTVKPGEYKLLLLARRPIGKEGDPIGNYGKSYGSYLLKGTSNVSNQNYYIAGDLSDSSFTLK